MLTTVSAAPAYELRNAGDKGLGLFAMRALQPGDVVLVDEPLTVVTCDPGTQPGEAQARQLIAALADLSPAKRNTYLSLANHCENPNVPDWAGIFEVRNS